MAKLDPDELQKRLARALKVGGDTYTPADVVQAVEEGRMQAWTNGDTLVVTEIVQYPQCSAINIFMAVGRLDEVMALQPAIEAFGKDHGCDRMYMTGRVGWKAVLPKFGWQEKPRSYFERTLNNG